MDSGNVYVSISRCSLFLLLLAQLFHEDLLFCHHIFYIPLYAIDSHQSGLGVGSPLRKYKVRFSRCSALPEASTLEAFFADFTGFLCAGIDPVAAHYWFEGTIEDMGILVFFYGVVPEIRRFIVGREYA